MPCLPQHRPTVISILFVLLVQHDTHLGKNTAETQHTQSHGQTSMALDSRSGTRVLSRIRTPVPAETVSTAAATDHAPRRRPGQPGVASGPRPHRGKCHPRAPVGEQLSRYLPHVKFVFPNAPVLPITGNGGMLTPAWYDVFSASGITHKQDEPGLLRSRQQVMQLIREEVEQHNIPTERIIIGGFSQGCVLALFVALTSEHRFAGIVSLSGYLPLRTKIIDMITDESRKTPIFWGHGTADQVVKYDFGQQSVEFLQKNRYQVDFHPYPRMGHSACPEEIRDLLEYFKETLPEDLPIMAKA